MAHPASVVAESARTARNMKTPPPMNSTFNHSTSTPRNVAGTGGTHHETGWSGAGSSMAGRCPVSARRCHLPQRARSRHTVTIRRRRGPSGRNGSGYNGRKPTPADDRFREDVLQASPRRKNCRGAALFDLAGATRGSGACAPSTTWRDHAPRRDHLAGAECASALWRRPPSGAAVPGACFVLFGRSADLTPPAACAPPRR